LADADHGMTVHKRKSTVRRSRGSRLASLIGRLTFWCWFVLLTAWVSSWFVAGSHWIADLLSNTCYAAVVPLLLTLIVLAYRRRWRKSLIVGCLLLISVWPILAGNGSPPAGTLPSPQSESPRTISIIVFNAHGQHEAMTPFARILEREQPDVVAIVELHTVSARYLLSLGEIGAMYPFTSLVRSNEPWPAVLLSRHPMHRLEFDQNQASGGESSKPELPFLFPVHRSYRVDSPAGRFVFSAMHLTSPRTPSAWRQGNRQLGSAIRLINDNLLPIGCPVIFAGDFNSTPTGARHRRLAQETSLHPANSLGRFSGTWPSALPGLLRLALDQVWVSQPVQTVSVRVLEPSGSDHRPLLVVLDLPPEGS
jgi:endonuclease/exonuclease/phosphatase (EEP) superfamily protein YafD